MIPDTLKTYVHAILTQRDWSWAVIGLAYLMVGLIIRAWFLRPLVVRAKELNRGPYEELKRAYLKRAPLGWVFFLLSFIIVIGLWNRGSRLPLSVKEALAILAAIVSYVISLICHLQALGIGAILALRKTTERGMDI